MAIDDHLADYHAKRDPRRTPEPLSSHARAGAEPRFVVQRHDASSLHFDFRLEIAGVLVSWSVPKGPSLDPKDRRLAIRTEDHPLDYADFEGVIPKGQYGGGTVVVWDTGTFDNLAERPGSDALADGHLKVRLHGEKLTGAFSLIRTDSRGRQEQWLLIKKDDEGADRRRKPAKTQPESVLSGKTNEELERS
jgi:DNA ligase D-like protein (predicted 3'-phosphoesterase)